MVLRNKLLNRTATSIANEHGISLRTAIRWCKKAGILVSVHHGERHHKARLTAEDVKLIWALQGALFAREVAEKFEVGETTIYDIWSQRTWYRITSALPP